MAENLLSVMRDLLYSILVLEFYEYCVGKNYVQHQHFLLILTLLGWFIRSLDLQIFSKNAYHEKSVVLFSFKYYLEYPELVIMNCDRKEERFA